MKTIRELEPLSFYSLADGDRIHYHLKIDDKQFISVPNFGTDEVGIKAKILDSRLAVVGEYGEEYGWDLDREVLDVLSQPIKKFTF